MPSNQQKTSGMCSIHAVEYYSAVKKEGRTGTHYSVLLKERSRTQTTSCYAILFV